MKKFLALCVLMAMSELICARVIKAWTYQEMVDQSDLIVIAVPLASKATGETRELANIKVVGLATEFRIRAILKGARPNQLILHHYQYEQPDQPMINGPNLIGFESSRSNSFLLFLVCEGNGVFAPVTGQTDPSEFSILRLDGAAQ